MDSCRDEPLQGAAACGPVDAEPKSAAAAAAAAVVNVAVVTVAAAAAVSVDVNGAEAAVAACVPFQGLCERQVHYLQQLYWAVNDEQYWESGLQLYLGAPP